MINTNPYPLSPVAVNAHPAGFHSSLDPVSPFSMYSSQAVSPMMLGDRPMTDASLSNEELSMVEMMADFVMSESSEPQVRGQVANGPDSYVTSIGPAPDGRESFLLSNEEASMVGMMVDVMGEPSPPEVREQVATIDPNSHVNNLHPPTAKLHIEDRLTLLEGALEQAVAEFDAVDSALSKKGKAPWQTHLNFSTYQVSI